MDRVCQRHEVVYEDGYKVIVPVQYGVNIMEWYAGGENSFDKKVGKTGSSQNTYCYKGDPISCSTDERNNPILLIGISKVEKKRPSSMRK